MVLMRNVLKREECIKTEGNLPLICLRIPLICRFTTATPSTYLSAKTLICLETTTTPSTYLSANSTYMPFYNGNAFHLFVCENTYLTGNNDNAFHLFVCEATPSTYLSAKQRQRQRLPFVWKRSYLSAKQRQAKIPYFSGRFGVGDRCPLPPF